MDRATKERIADLARQFGISRARLKALADAGYLANEPLEPALLESIRKQLRSGRPLSVRQVVGLIENPIWVIKLGKKARQALEDLDLAVPDPDAKWPRIEAAAPRALWPHIEAAAERKSESVAVLRDWMQSTIITSPTLPLTHQWLAARLILGVPKGHRDKEYRRVIRAFAAVREDPLFEGWWRVERRKGRAVVLYDLPAEMGDL